MDTTARYAPPADVDAEIVAPPRLSIGAIYLAARASYGARSGTLVIAALLYGVALFGGGALLDSAAARTGDPVATVVVSQLLRAVLGAWLTGGLTRLALAAARDEPIVPWMVFMGHASLLPLFLINLVTMVGGGFLLLCLVVPGVLFLLAISQANFLAVDRGLGAGEAIGESLVLTRGHRGQLFWLWLAQAVVILVGLLALGIGVLVALPVAQLMSAHAYLQLQALREEESRGC
ncbi:MAG: hypothetical protein JNL79_19415 [Myxococcales bacterium]|nr:hypothetical protein [Myxococcales bacterium]